MTIERVPRAALAAYANATAPVSVAPTTTPAPSSRTPPPTCAARVLFAVDMSRSPYPDASYPSVVANGNWNGWQGWGVSLADDDGDGVFSGELALPPGGGQYEYVFAVTGAADSWNGWGASAGGDVGGACDYTPGDSNGNYGFTVPAACEALVLAQYVWGSCNVSSESPAPTPLPTLAPSVMPTSAPSARPARVPWPIPTMMPAPTPTTAPVPAPTARPTTAPAPAPTAGPFPPPIHTPSTAPKPAPSASPTPAPLAAPTAGSPMSQPSPLPSDSMSVTVVVQLTFDGVTTADWDDAADSALKATIARLIDGIEERDIRNVVVAGNNDTRRRRLLAVTVSFDIYIASSAVESVANALAATIEDGTFTSALQTEAEAAGSDALAAAEVASISSAAQATFSPSAHPSLQSGQRNDETHDNDGGAFVKLVFIAAVILLCGGCGTIMAASCFRLKASKKYNAEQDAPPPRATMSNDVELTSGMRSHSDRMSNATATDTNPLATQWPNAKPQTDSGAEQQPAVNDRPPGGEDWVAYTDESSGGVYYYETTTGRSTWTEQNTAGAQRKHHDPNESNLLNKVHDAVMRLVGWKHRGNTHGQKNALLGAVPGMGSEIWRRACRMAPCAVAPGAGRGVALSVRLAPFIAAPFIAGNFLSFLRGGEIGSFSRHAPDDDELNINPPTPCQ